MQFYKVVTNWLNYDYSKFHTHKLVFPPWCKPATIPSIAWASWIALTEHPNDLGAPPIFPPLFTPNGLDLPHAFNPNCHSSTSLQVTQPPLPHPISSIPVHSAAYPDFGPSIRHWLLCKHAPHPLVFPSHILIVALSAPPSTGPPSHAPWRGLSLRWTLVPAPWVPALLPCILTMLSKPSSADMPTNSSMIILPSSGMPTF